jgi:colicin import membrane protein
MHNPDPKKPSEEQEKSTLERVVDAISGFISTPISDETDEIAKRPAMGGTPARAAPAAKAKRRVTRKAAGSKKAAAATKKKRSAGTKKRSSGTRKKSTATRKRSAAGKKRGAATKKRSAATKKRGVSKKSSATKKRAGAKKRSARK